MSRIFVLPELSSFTIGLLLSAAVAWLALRVAARLRHRGIDVAHTRKVFHFLIFTTATLLHAACGLAWVNTFAGGVVLVILFGCVLAAAGGEHGLTVGLVRPRDEPHGLFFVVVPLATTALGGVASNLLFGEAALVGYLVTGWGDAVGEPAGRALGRRRYCVATLLGGPQERTLEGSLAVGLASFAAAALALAFAFSAPLVSVLSLAIIIAVVTVLVEAASPHGADNFTTMVAAAGIAWLGLG